MKILKYSLIVFLLTISHSGFCQQFSSLKNGDLLFQDLDCGPLCDAIEAVTKGKDTFKFSHVGILYIHDGVFEVIEAIGDKVQIHTLDKFLSRTPKATIVGRVKDKKLINKAIQFALKQVGKGYDDIYTYGDEKYYCSELVYDAFKYANNDRPYFSLKPMTFKEPGSQTYYPVWVAYFNNKNIPIPEGKLGCNPGGISTSNHIQILNSILTNPTEAH